MADFPEFRDMLFKNGAFTFLIQVLEKALKMYIVEKGVWAFSKFCETVFMTGVVRFLFKYLECQ